MISIVMLTLLLGTSITQGVNTFSFVVFGDMNGGGCDRLDRLERLVALMDAEQNAAFFISTGDFIDGFAIGPLNAGRFQGQTIAYPMTIH